MAIAAVAIAGCAPEEIRGPQTVRVIVFDAARDRFQLADRKLDTLEELTGLHGATTEFRTGARLVRDARDEKQSLTCAEFSDSFVEDGGGRPSLSFIDDNGVWVAEDFDSLVMVSTYYNFEFSREFFVAAGVPVGDLDRSTTFYEPTLISYDSEGGRSLGFDPQAFEPCIAAFVFFAGDPLQEIPQGANLGVAAHEYSHLVFDRVVYGGRGEDSTLVPSNQAASRRLLALNEGLADYFGAAIVGNPRFVSRTLATSTSALRNLVPGAAWAQALEDTLVTSPTADGYGMGTVWASLLWDVAIALPDGQAAAASLALRMLDSLKSARASAVETRQVLDALFASATAEQAGDDGAQLNALCDAFDARFFQFRLFDITEKCGP